MPRDSRRSGMSLILAGLGAIAFSWLSDPRWGVVPQSVSNDMVEAVNQARAGTWIGIAGGTVITIFGLWLFMRRST